MHTLFVLTIADSVDRDEMPHNMAFHQGLHCLLRQKRSSENKLQFHLEIVTCGPRIMQWTIPTLLNQFRIISEGRIRFCSAQS